MKCAVRQCFNVAVCFSAKNVMVTLEESVYSSTIVVTNRSCKISVAMPDWQVF